MDKENLKNYTLMRAKRIDIFAVYLLFFLISNLGFGRERNNDRDFFVVTAMGNIPLSYVCEDIDTANLGDETFRMIQEEALKKTNELSNYISIIGDKKETNERKLKCIDLALLLFADENQIVQISSTRDSERIKSYKIRRYLQNLRVLDYGEVKIDWFDIKYEGDYIKGADGIIYTTITVYQRFVGYDHEGKKAYEDITEKTIEVGVEFRDPGQAPIPRWDVKLRNIKVVQTIENE